MTLSTKNKLFPGKQMGLLKKAIYFNHSSDRGCGLLKKILQLKKQENINKGNPLISNSISIPLNTPSLLRKLMSFAYTKQGIITDYRPPLINTELTRNILNGMEKIPGSLEFPCNLFSSLKEQLDFPKAALFLLSHYKPEYLPWSKSGLSIDELNNLALTPQSAVTKLFQNKSYEVIEQAYLFKGIDSKKISPLILIPFIYNNNIIAILAVFKIAIHTHSIEIFFNFLVDVAHKAAEIIYKKRQFQIESLTRNNYQKYDNIKQAANMLYQECNELGISLYFIDISLGTLLQKVRQHNEYINLNCFQDDIQLFFNSLLTHLGVVFPQEENKMLFIVKGYETLNPKLLLHQSYLSLANFFKEISQNWQYDFTYKLKTFPYNDKSIEELTKEFTLIKT